MELCNLYAALGVAVSAGDADIRSACRRKALATHPDKGGSPEAFRLVVRAFETLADPRLRAAHDRELERAKTASQNKREAKEPVQVSQPGKRCRQDEPRESKSEAAKAKRKCEASAGNQDSSSHIPPEAISNLARELLRLPVRSMRSRLKKLVPQVLRALLKFLDTADLQAESAYEEEHEKCKSGSEDDPRTRRTFGSLRSMPRSSRRRPEGRSGDTSRQKGSRAKGAKWCPGYPFTCVSSS